MSPPTKTTLTVRDCLDARMTDFQHALWLRVIASSKAGLWYRAATAAETRSLRGLHSRGYFVRRARRGSEAFGLPGFCPTALRMPRR